MGESLVHKCEGPQGNVTVNNYLLNGDRLDAVVQWDIQSVWNREEAGGHLLPISDLDTRLATNPQETPTYVHKLWEASGPFLQTDSHLYPNWNLSSVLDKIPVAWTGWENMCHSTASCVSAESEDWYYFSSGMANTWLHFTRTGFPHSAIGHTSNKKMYPRTDKWASTLQDYQDKLEVHMNIGRVASEREIVIIFREW